MAIKFVASSLYFSFEIIGLNANCFKKSTAVNILKALKFSFKAKFLKA